MIYGEAADQGAVRMNGRAQSMFCLDHMITRNQQTIEEGSSGDPLAKELESDKFSAENGAA